MDLVTSSVSSVEFTILFLSSYEEFSSKDWRPEAMLRPHSESGERMCPGRVVCPRCLPLGSSAPGIRAAFATARLSTTWNLCELTTAQVCVRSPLASGDDFCLLAHILIANLGAKCHDQVAGTVVHDSRVLRKLSWLSVICAGPTPASATYIHELVCREKVSKRCPGYGGGFPPKKLLVQPPKGT